VKEFIALLRYVIFVEINKDQYLDDDYSNQKIDIINTLSAYYLNKSTLITNKMERKKSLDEVT